MQEITAAELAHSLPDIASTLSAQMDQLCAMPCADAAERLAINLGGAQRAVLRLRERLMAEGVDGNR